MSQLSKRHYITKRVYKLSHTGIDFLKNWTEGEFSCKYSSIKHCILKFNFLSISTMFTKLREKFPQNPEERGISRRSFLRGGVTAAFMAAAFMAVVSAASLPLGNDAEAGEAKAATTETITDEQARAITQKAREMRHYSEDEATKGVGVFINLQKDAPMTGEQIGEHLRMAFGSLKPPISLEYRVNQSQGTATDITFYVQGYDFTMTVTDIAQKGIGSILAHHQDVWSEQVSLIAQPQ